MPHSSASLPDLVHAVSRGLRRSWIHALSPHGISPHEFRALRTIAIHTENPPLRQRDLAEALRIAPRSAAEVVTRLEDLGYVTRGPHPDDKRAVVVTATEAGRATEESIRQRKNEAGMDYFAVLNTEDAAELARILEVLVAEHPRPCRVTPAESTWKASSGSPAG